jgi:clan AA aspartic protease
MGHVFVNAVLEGTKKSEAIRMLVDTGATFSAIAKETAERIGVPKLKPSKVKLADGREVEAEAGVVRVGINEREAPTTVLTMGEEALLGVETLEVLGLKVNPETGELEPTRSFVVRVEG